MIEGVNMIDVVHVAEGAYCLHCLESVDGICSDGSGDGLHGREIGRDL